MHKYFIFDKFITLLNTSDRIKPEGRYLFIQHDSIETLKVAINILVKEEVIQRLYIASADMDKLKTDFESLFDIIEAAGGLVYNNKNELLMIYRNGKWDLPKGKIEKGEAVKAAAVREVEEECGVKNLSLGQELKPSCHIYMLDNKMHLKKTYWYKMTCPDVPLTPQKEEGITEARWMNKQGIEMALKNTYLSIKDVLQEKC